MSQRFFVLLVLLLSLALAVPSLAGTREGGTSLSLTAGGVVFDGMEKLNAGPAIGVRLGYDAHKSMGFEGSFAFINTRGRVDRDQVYGYIYRAEALYYLLPDSNFVPFLAAGIGGMSLIDSPVYGNRNSLLLDYGLGVKYFVADTVALRADARGLATYDTNAHGHGEFSVGVNYYFGRGEQATAVKPVAMEEPAPAPAPVVVQQAAPPVVEKAEPAVAAPVVAKVVEAPAPAVVAVPEPPAPVYAPAPVPVSEPLQVAAGECGSCRARTVTNVAVVKNGVEVVADLGVENYKVFKLSKPSRLVIDICCASDGNGGKSSRIDVNRMGIGTVRTGIHPDKVRVVLESPMSKFPSYRVEKGERGIKVVLK